MPFNIRGGASIDLPVNAPANANNRFNGIEKPWGCSGSCRHRLGVYVTIEYILRHIEDAKADFGLEVEEVAEGTSMPCSGGWVWPKLFEGRNIFNCYHDE